MPRRFGRLLRSGIPPANKKCPKKPFDFLIVVTKIEFGNGVVVRLIVALLDLLIIRFKVAKKNYNHYN